MDGKQKLIAAIDDPNGIPEDDWYCIMPFMDELSPIWEDVSCHRHRYFIPKKYKDGLKAILQRTDVVITYHDDQENDMVLVDDETLPDHERAEKSARYYYQMATSAYDLADFDTAFNEMEKCLELDATSPEYLSFASQIAFAIDASTAKKNRVIEVKEVDISTLRCGACKGPYHPATGHAFFVKDELKGVACGICAGRHFAAKARASGWAPRKLSKKQRRQKRKKQQREYHLSNARRIVAEARGEYPYWPSGADV